MTHRTRVRVRYAETDRMGVVYYANYLVWFEVGRTEWLRQAGWSYREMEREAGVQLPVIEAHCEYRQPARYDDEVDIDARATMLTPVRVRFDYTLTRAADTVVLAEGHTVHAAVDRSGRPCRLPDRVRESLGAPAGQSHRSGGPVSQAQEPGSTSNPQGVYNVGATRRPGSPAELDTNLTA